MHPEENLSKTQLEKNAYTVILRKISKIGATKMSDFKAKMHQIRFPLGKLTALPQTP